MAKKAKLESSFQSALIRQIENDILPGSIVMPVKREVGKPDLLVLYNDHWAALECKRESNSHRQPNQPYWVDRMNFMSFARFISPENKEEVLRELQSAFKV